MTTSFRPVIAPEVSELRPDFRLLSVVARNLVNRDEDGDAAAFLTDACSRLDEAPWAASHLAAWQETYKAFGAKPQRTPCSAEALRKRVAKEGRLPPANAVVDIYNAVSLRFAVPVGGENLAAYVGAPRLARATGVEPFDTAKDGIPVQELVDAGEVIWKDDLGATCRRWNWRQGRRTRIDVDSRDIWFVLEALGPMPDTALEEAGEVLVRELKRLSPGATFETETIRAVAG
ncbi:B3/4 domain-containing protein [Dongia soli]|uniref:Phenylalanine--tRNA ligase beta subunit-related protein n=1 Tax=Dongia soli TaxID=600628 RepID=A0ABU5E704_9PROT|nr:phenylalanine--tRNA ligase beta subunit-related protein [Dongia soli]MDY0881499.1 phenylalanine--tRNA ligase beta subunit-related protein [Dongia soli]